MEFVQVLKKIIREKMRNKLVLTSNSGKYNLRFFGDEAPLF